ncbi:DMT(drug/metabolite transporter) superfamily permease [Desulfitobacterium dehalogenans ATCC 51507]|uniref:DMT(Drug/metabolite transporter) superfamily permease n=1 Tax=Desulfitobacterium dehalogenans (strain ATCC 51507 / DSM 9161 / JW/IU-DC1) TaxID=756499 RepID=I4A9D4_DESDJ|nr:DMT family transporter [Desulfitobacterium dehalogenans]AFM00569.1 DMT(drug/metabolite transporter) superfamily permease [Desulfitobacterium dehalogenans ATCC 51507]
MDTKKEVQGHLLALITIFIWGTTFISTKLLLESITPIVILFLRFAIGFLVLLLAYPHRLKIRERTQDLYFAAAGLCGVTLYFLLENMALTYTFASNVGVIVSISPFFTAIFAHLFLDTEKLRVRFFMGFSVAVVGIILISFNGGNNLQLNPLGDILGVLAAVVWAAYSVLTKKISGFQYNTIQATRRIFFYGLVFMIPALIIFGFKPDITELTRPTNLFNILFLGLGASALCFVTWNSAVKLLGAVKTSVYIYMVPVITVITAVIVLRERITGASVFGIVLTLAGLLISERKGRHIPEHAGAGKA